MITQEEIKIVMETVHSELGEKASDVELYAREVLMSICKKELDILSK